MNSKRAKRDRMARRTNEVSERHQTLDQRFEIVTLSDNPITDTGLLTVAELKPKTDILACLHSGSVGMKRLNT